MSRPSCLDSDLDGEEPKNGDHVVQGEEGRPAACSAHEDQPKYKSSGGDLDEPIESEESSSGIFECCYGLDDFWDSDRRRKGPKYKSSGGGPPARSAEKKPQYKTPPARSAEKKPQRRSRRRQRWEKLACLNCGCTQWTRRRWPWREKNFCGWCRYGWDSGYFWNLDCTKTRWYQCRRTYWWHFEPRSGDETKWHSWHRGVEWYFSAAECRDWWRAQTRSFVLAGVEQWGGPSEIPRLRR